MRSQVSPPEFFAKMKKKPALQKILDVFETLSLEDIEKLDQPLWIRVELLRQKEVALGGNIEENAMVTAEESADQMEGYDSGIKAEYDVYEYRGENWFPSITSGFAMEIAYGDTFLVLESYKCQISSTVMNITARSWQPLIMNSISLGKMTNDAYRAYVQETLNNKYSGSQISPMGGDSAVDNSPAGRLGQLGVRIK